MLQKSLKWMILTLLLAGLLIGGVVWLVSALRDAPAAVQEAPTAAQPGASATATPAGQSPTPAVTPAPTATPMSEEARLAQWVAGLPVEEKLGQLVMFGSSGASSVSDAFSDVLETYCVGNAVLYGTNVAQGDADGGFSRAARLTAALRNTCRSEIPMLISIDVEGGSVVRFRWSPWPSSAQALGTRNDPDAAYRQFRTIGETLLETGINLNLAPVLDVAPDPDDTFLGTRIISSDAVVTSDIGAAIITGLHDAGCLSAAKHFPGHGGTSADSHATTPVVDKSADELFEYDLVPFAAAVEAGVDVVLVAHIRYPALDPENIASLSPAIIGGLLREELGFDGIVMSDDFRMGGLTSQCPAGEAAVRFLLAGGDLILCGPRHDLQREIMDALRAAADDGTLSEARIDESVLRIVQKKMQVTGWSPLE